MSSDYGHLAQVRDRAMAEPNHPQKLVNVRLDYLDAVLKHYVKMVTDSADQMRAYAEAAASIAREAMVEEAAKQGWAMRNDDPFECAVREIAGICAARPRPALLPAHPYR